MKKYLFEPSALEDFVAFGKTDYKLQEKILALLNDAARNPFTGLGKPEPLKHGKYKGFWSRRITQEHRLVYAVTDTAICVLSCKLHYE
ncbi:MAG: Txe/YoeB family addiction module toxin [Candidatus Kapaibacterium sp.]|nr:MAG: Txe/YoeB family addiction module toxin [Candidatus Kapabacteria bacterium]